MSTGVGLYGGGIMPHAAKAFILIPNTKTLLQGSKIRKLPYTIAEMSVEAQKKFISALNSANKWNFRIFTGAGQEAWVQKRFEEAQKSIPPGHYTEKIFLLIKATGIIFVAIMAVMNAQSRL
jgi:hypothetical protein